MKSVLQSVAAERDDLYQEGMLGLLYAARTYDGQRSACFEAYAGMCIKCRMTDYLRKQMTDKKKTAILVRKLDEGGENTVSDPEEIFLSEERAKEITENLSESFRTKSVISCAGRSLKLPAAGG